MSLFQRLRNLTKKSTESKVTPISGSSQNRYAFDSTTSELPDLSVKRKGQKASPKRAFEEDEDEYEVKRLTQSSTTGARYEAIPRFYNLIGCPDRQAQRIMIKVEERFLQPSYQINTRPIKERLFSMGIGELFDISLVVLNDQKDIILVHSLSDDPISSEIDPSEIQQEWFQTYDRHYQVYPCLVNPPRQRPSLKKKLQRVEKRLIQTLPSMLGIHGFKLQENYAAATPEQKDDIIRRIGHLWDWKEYLKNKETRMMTNRLVFELLQLQQYQRHLYLHTRKKIIDELAHFREGHRIACAVFLSDGDPIRTNRLLEEDTSGEIDVEARKSTEAEESLPTPVKEETKEAKGTEVTKETGESARSKVYCSLSRLSQAFSFLIEGLLRVKRRLALRYDWEEVKVDHSLSTLDLPKSLYEEFIFSPETNSREFTRQLLDLIPRKNYQEELALPLYGSLPDHFKERIILCPQGSKEWQEIGRRYKPVLSLPLLEKFPLIQSQLVKRMVATQLRIRVSHQESTRLISLGWIVARQEPNKGLEAIDTPLLLLSGKRELLPIEIFFTGKDSVTCESSQKSLELHRQRLKKAVQLLSVGTCGLIVRLSLTRFPGATVHRFSGDIAQIDFAEELIV